MDLAIKLIVLLPLLAAAIAGLFCRVIGDRPAQIVTCAALLIAAALSILVFVTIGLGHYLSVASVLFTLGILGIFLNRKNVIVILMCVELMLLAVNINLVAFSVFQGNVVGQVFAMLVLTVAAAEAAIGLAILVVYFRNRGTIEVEDINAMRG